MLDFSLSFEQKTLRQTVKRFVEKEIVPIALEFEKDEMEGNLAHKVIQKAAQAGISGLPVPEKYGGGGASGIECNIALEELAVGCGGIATAIGASWFGQTPILMAATKEQRERWFPILASRDEGHLVCMAMTEPQSGSDIENAQMGLRTVRTRVRFEGDDIVVTGTKLWPSNFDVSTLYTVVATTDPQEGPEGSCLVVVERGAKGLSFSKPVPKMGMHADRNGEIIFEDVRIPKENMLGKVGDGFKLLQRTLVYNRVGAGAISVGMARGAFERALKWAKERTVMGKPLAEHPVVSSKLAEMAVKIEMSRMLVWRAAWYNAQPKKRSMKWASMAKVYASDLAMEVTTDAVQIMGSCGYAREYGVEKYMRDNKIIQIYIGANELTKQVIGEELLTAPEDMFEV